MTENVHFKREKRNHKQIFELSDLDWKANRYLSIANKDYNDLVDDYNFLAEQYNALIEKCEDYELIVEEYMDLTCRLSKPINDECDEFIDDELEE